MMKVIFDSLSATLAVAAQFVQFLPIGQKKVALISSSMSLLSVGIDRVRFMSENAMSLSEDDMMAIRLGLEKDFGVLDEALSQAKAAEDAAKQP